MLKDKKIDIIGFVEYENEMGQISYKRKVVVSKAWAYYRHISSKEESQLDKIDNKVDVIFGINYRKELDPSYDAENKAKALSYEIDFRGQLYKVSRIDNYEGYKDDLKLYAYIKDRH